ncbi:helix-turn-helix domain-containing protein [Pseudomonas sp. B21-053]|uniref:helix-turn-helix domain-containing protein n=1 Tax=Pseudomonas sp. B21-053 TaxID=2895493 RepID=UPI0022326C09|nr:helix-turn-helix transcriptional regulator [Pseudomonas sp. B21-053]UZE12317.1 helix-turn-helix domain-containing protein [Pseudomonas sp. B21-053]
MAIQFFDSPFHVTHDEEVASKMALKMELSIFITDFIKKLGLKQNEAAAKLGVTQSRVSELTTGKIEKFTIDAMMDMLDKLGFRSTFTLPSNDVGELPQIVISQARVC